MIKLMRIKSGKCLFIILCLLVLLPISAISKVNSPNFVKGSESNAPKYYNPNAAPKTTTPAQIPEEIQTPADQGGEAKQYKKIFAEFETSMGSFTAELFPLIAPKAVENFVGLATGTKKFIDAKSGNEEQRPYYDGLIFHRVVPKFLIQSGCPLGNGTGGPGHRFEDEFHPLYRHAKPGVLGMANAGPNQNGSQFYITLASAQDLDNKHTVFGQVISGMPVVEAIGRVRTDIHDKPLVEVRLIHVKITYK